MSSIDGRVLYRLCRDGTPEQLRCFMAENGMDGKSLNHTRGFRTGMFRACVFLPLNAAVESGNLNNVLFLLEAGANPDMEHNGFSPRFSALDQPFTRCFYPENRFWWESAAEAHAQQPPNVSSLNIPEERFAESGKLPDEKQLIWALLAKWQVRQPDFLCHPDFPTLPDRYRELVIRSVIRKAKLPETEKFLCDSNGSPEIIRSVRAAMESPPDDLSEKLKGLLSSVILLDREMMFNLLETVCSERDAVFLFQYLLESDSRMCSRKQIPAMNELMTILAVFLTSRTK